MAFQATLTDVPSPTPPFSGSGVVTTIEELCEQWKGFSNDHDDLFDSFRLVVTVLALIISV